MGFSVHLSPAKSTHRARNSPSQQNPAPSAEPRSAKSSSQPAEPELEKDKTLMSERTGRFGPLNDAFFLDQTIDLLL